MGVVVKPFVTHVIARVSARALHRSKATRTGQCCLSLSGQIAEIGGIGDIV